MTLLAVSYYYRCRVDPSHTFEHGEPDLKWCPKCGGPVRMYGLKDSPLTEPIDDDDAAD